MSISVQPTMRFIQNYVFRAMDNYLKCWVKKDFIRCKYIFFCSFRTLRRTVALYVNRTFVTLIWMFFICSFISDYFICISTFLTVSIVVCGAYLMWNLVECSPEIKRVREKKKQSTLANIKIQMKKNETTMNKRLEIK